MGTIGQGIEEETRAQHTQRVKIGWDGQRNLFIFELEHKKKETGGKIGIFASVRAELRV